MDGYEANDVRPEPAERDARQRVLQKLALVRESQRKTAMGRSILAGLQRTTLRAPSD
jgi:hypothetical protein